MKNLNDKKKKNIKKTHDYDKDLLTTKKPKE